MPVVRYGKANLLDLFDGRHQLIICHFMLDPDVSEGCPDCSHLVDNIPIWRIYTRHLARARVPRTARQDRALPGADGWTVPWYSPFGSDFNSISTSPRMKPSPASRTIIRTKRRSNARGRLIT